MNKSSIDFFALWNSVVLKNLKNRFDKHNMFKSIKNFPSQITEKKYDLLISYISTWIVPKAVLAKTKRWNINFHPGSLEYPGIGCFNFAIFDSAK